MKKRLSILIATCLIALTFPQAVLADIPYELPHVNEPWAEQVNPDAKTADILNTSTTTVTNINVTNGKGSATISGKFTKGNTSFYLVVRRVSDDAVKFINDGQTNATGEFSMVVELNEGDYSVEAICSNEKLTKGFKVSSGGTTNPDPDPPSGGGGGGSSSGGSAVSSNSTSPSKFDANGRILIPLSLIESLAGQNKPLVLENNGVKLTFSTLTFSASQITKALQDKAVTLEVVIRVMKPSEQQEALKKTNLGQSTGLMEIGGVMVELSLQLIHADGSKSLINLDPFNEPVAVTFDLSKLKVSDADIAQLTAVRYVQDDKGNLTAIKLGGSYDPAKRTFTFHTDHFSLYGILKASELKTIRLTVNSLTTTVNGLDKLNDVAPIVVNNRTMVPARLIAESFGAKVEWDEGKQEVTILLDGKTLKMTINKVIEGFDTAPIVVNDRALVPIRYISEQFGASVLWFPSTEKIEIVK